MELEKRDNESPLEYQRRLIYGKQVDHTLSDIDYTELSKYVYGRSYAPDVARRMMYGSRYTLELVDQEKVDNVDGDDDLLSEMDQKILEYKTEKQKLSDERNAYNKTIRDRARQEELNEIIEKAVEKNTKNGNLAKLVYSRPRVLESDNDLLVSLNDIHYGIDIDNAWNKYNPEICASMMAEYLDQILEIQKRHRSENCIVYDCGDNISGKIHPTIQIANRENVVEQIKGVSELIAEFLVVLGNNFRTVKFISVPGNHSRLDTKDDAPYDERLDDLVEWYLKARLKEIDNIEICSDCRIDPSMSVFTARGKWYCAVHGDYDSSDSKVLALQSMSGKDLYAILKGHLHHNMYNTVQGIRVLMSGAFCGEDDYTSKKRIIAEPEQIVSVIDSSGIVCNYDIRF